MMGSSRRAIRVMTDSAHAATAAAGAMGGAAVSGVIGGVRGTAAGVKSGLRSGGHSTPAAALTLGAIGAAGLVEWPVLAVVGGTALLVRELTKPSPEDKPQPPAAVSAPPRGTTTTTTPAKASTPRARNSTTPAHAQRRR
jgi:hypothetical protein